MASEIDQVRQAANRVNTSLLEYIVSLSEETARDEDFSPSISRVPTIASKEASIMDRQDSTPNAKPPRPVSREVENAKGSEAENRRSSEVQTSSPPPKSPPPSKQTVVLDYAAAVNALTLQFLNEQEATRIGALTWLIMLHQKAPRKVRTITPDQVWLACLQNTDRSLLSMTVPFLLSSRLYPTRPKLWSPAICNFYLRSRRTAKMAILLPSW